MKTSTAISDESFNNRINNLSEDMERRKELFDSIDNEIDMLKEKVKLFINIKKKKNGRIISLKDSESAIKIK